MKYLPRVVDSELSLRLRSIGATLIVGPKWCGKTTTAKISSTATIINRRIRARRRFLARCCFNICLRRRSSGVNALPCRPLSICPLSCCLLFSSLILYTFLPKGILSVIKILCLKV